jgi:hypothetical protein
MLSKYRRDNWYFDVGCTWAISQGISSSDTQNVVREETGWFQPAEEACLDWDQRITMNAVLDYRLPRGGGPRIGGYPFLEGFGVNLRWSYGSGYPYTTTVQDPLASPAVNTKRYPRTYRTDLRVNRTFYAGDVSVDLVCEVLNLFNRHNIFDIKDVAWYEAGLETGGYD